ncbi:MAG: nucleotidyltransferase [Clostridia bacterium]|nr:nucleotidyltransferase [Clostridia bacterium]
MNLLGIIAEYNPFHNGHKYHIERSKDFFKPDATVAVLSGNFTQRGDIACFDKWTRTKCALLNGVDLVVELPAIFATASAERFAQGGIYLLDKMKAKYLSFGVENNIDELSKIVDMLLNEDFEIQKKSEIPFYKLRQLSLNNSEIVTKPNNILAIEYLKALKTLKSDIIPHAVKRFGAGYNDIEIINNTVSATKLRDMIQNDYDYSNVIPENLDSVYKSAVFLHTEMLFAQLIYSIKSKSASELKEYAHIREGIENRIYKYAFEATSFDDLIKKVKSKRYTYTSVSRMLISILLDIKKDDLCVHPQYIRVLGLNDKGTKALKFIKSQCDLPIITKTATVYDKLSNEARNSLDIDIKSSDIYYSISKTVTSGRPDFINSPIKI